jgi:xylulose-5-phosphate/fructose-6-phosphate phosphoketolase
VTGDDPAQVHHAMARAVDEALDRIATTQGAARADGAAERAHWPVIVLRTPKGWTGPAEVDGEPVEGTWRAHQVPLAGVRENPEYLKQLETWLRSYRPQELFGPDGRPTADVLVCLPDGAKRLGSTAHANGGLLVRDLPLRPLDDFAVPVEKPGTTLHGPTRVLGDLLAQVMTDTGSRRDFRVVGPDETASNGLQAVIHAAARPGRPGHCRSTKTWTRMAG